MILSVKEEIVMCY